MGSIPVTNPFAQSAFLESADGTVSARVTWSGCRKRHPARTTFGTSYAQLTIDKFEYPGAYEDELDRRVGELHTVTATDGTELYKNDGSSSAGQALLFLWEASVAKISGSNAARPLSMLLVLPAEDGYMVKSDFLQEMFRNCPISDTVKGFTIPRQKCVRPENTSLLALLQSSVGAVVAKDGVELKELEAELENRISWPWTVPQPFELTRVAIIGERRHATRVPEFHQAAQACGISLVVLDGPGHWMQDDQGPGGKFREHFVPFDDYTLEELPHRAVEVIKNLPYRIDGLMTTVDSLAPGVARASEMLGLRTVPSDAIAKSADKHQGRSLSPTTTSVKIKDLEGFKAQLGKGEVTLSYPLVVKPTRSQGADGASRVDNNQELVEALKFAFATLDRHEKTLNVRYDEKAVIVETYCDGPEVDVNFVFWDGELLFSEVTDNLPCRANGEHQGQIRAQHFKQTASAFPSGLPQNEIDMLKRDVLAIIRRLGVDNGVVHAEAKVRNSSVEWSTQNGVLDLRPRLHGCAGDPETFLLEVNMRFPGIPDMIGSCYVNGIDYSALFLLHLIGDESRFRSLSHGFRDKPLYHYAFTSLRTSVCTAGYMPEFLPLDKYGLDDYYATHWQYFKSKELVPPAEQRPYPGLGWILWRSRRGRLELMQKVADAQLKLDVQLL